MKTFSDKTDDLDFFLNSKNFLKSKRKIMPDGFKKNKTVNEVLDKLTTLTLFNLIKSKTIAYVNGVVRAGKESVVFWAVSPDNNDVALKVISLQQLVLKNVRLTFWAIHGFLE